MSVSDISLEDAISSGSEYQIDTDQTSTTDSAKGNQKSGHQSRPRATRMKIRQQRAAVPFTSTPTATACANAAASFLLSDCETEDDHQFNLDKRCFSEKQHTEDILQIMERRMKLMEDKMWIAIGALRRDVAMRDRQIADMQKQLERLQRGRDSQEPVTGNKQKATNHAKATVRQALQNAETAGGMALNPQYKLEAEQNKEVVDYAWNFAKTALPAIPRPEFQVAMKRCLQTKKERASRQKCGSRTKRNDDMRKYSRKSTKSRNRVKGIRKADLPATKDQV
ncbi:uncharacterized protein LOC124278501 [Haliotis rubra]|uniref:uncharacterized protein LOC124278501 n=1 Tax=Haliotis rubra TaxID=36100 RepID=UPI001EE5E2EC|nr:uncharacterized protein LOC124278501 [Haliotis rubra]